MDIVPVIKVVPVSIDAVVSIVPMPGKQGEPGQDSTAQGPSGVVSVTSPLTNTGTSVSATLGLDQTALTLAESQITGLSADLANRVTPYQYLRSRNQEYIETIPRTGTTFASSGITVTSGTVYYTIFSPISPTEISGIAMFTGSVLGSGLTGVRMGLYGFNGSDMTLLAQTAKTTNTFTSANTRYFRSFDIDDGYPASYTVDLDTDTDFIYYALGVIVTGTTMPGLIGVTAPVNVASVQMPRLSRTTPGQTDLPASTYTFGNTGTQYWAAFE